jgi:hypothetical protein
MCANANDDSSRLPMLANVIDVCTAMFANVSAGTCTVAHSLMNIVDMKSIFANGCSVSVSVPARAHEHSTVFAAHTQPVGHARTVHAHTNTSAAGHTADDGSICSSDIVR